VFRRDRSPPRRRRSPRYATISHLFLTNSFRRFSEKDLQNSTTLFVGNLPYHFRERDVEEYFDRCGRLRNVTVGINRRTGQSKGYAFIEYENRRDAEEAMER
jgi:RNA recognition motif-containing protein